MTGLIVRIDLGPHGRLGPGKLLLLENIDKYGSISAAGRAMNMSYRQAWSLVDQLNQAFKEPVVTSQTGGKSGGGAALTEFGKLLVAHCSAIIANAKKTSGPHLEFIAAVLRPVANDEQPAAQIGRAAPPAKAANAPAQKAASKMSSKKK
jgi:molybdate transport system regulatory protein